MSTDAALDATGAPVFVVLTRRGLGLARRLAADLPGAEVHGLAGRAAGADTGFEETAQQL
ncbi:MAG: hypothetical protein IH786_03330, partial [Proteobacteria bacterium]|nr:hypothetical protein [Pseudomonadota bacterium]